MLGGSMSAIATDNDWIRLSNERVNEFYRGRGAAEQSAAADLSTRHALCTNKGRHDLPRS
jgi:hypothetical protein